MRVYISGPIKGVENAEEIFADYAKKLHKDLGWDIINPFDIGNTHCSCKNTDPRQPRHDYECYMRNDLIEMLKCDMIYMLPGWENSKGASLELYVATIAGMKVDFPYS